MRGEYGWLLTERKVLALLVIVLVVNTVLVIVNINFAYRHSRAEDAFPASSRDAMADNFLAYSQRLARDLGVQERNSVQEALARLNYEMAMAKTGDELARVVFNQGRQVQEIIVRESDALLREHILALVNRDPNLQAETGRVEFTINLSSTRGASVDPDVLHEDTKTAIMERVQSSGVVQEQLFRLEYAEGRSRMLVPYDPLDYIQFLNEEIDALRVSLHELRVASGYAEMIGEGLVIKLYDAPNGFAASEIIHDSDVRDVVNELFAAGAKGVSVGGQRLMSTSSIRCVGPVIRVNQREIPANPVVIEAVGDPEVLSSALDIVRFSLEFHRNFRMEIEKKDHLVLPPYRG